MWVVPPKRRPVAQQNYHSTPAVSGMFREDSTDQVDLQ